MWSMTPFASGVLPVPVPPTTRCCVRRATAVFDRPALLRRHDSLLFVLLQREHAEALRRIVKHRGRYDGRNQRLEAGAVERKLAFENWFRA